MNRILRSTKPGIIQINVSRAVFGTGDGTRTRILHAENVTAYVSRLLHLVDCLGLEPSSIRVSGGRLHRLSYQSIVWSSWVESNHRNRVPSAGHYHCATARWRCRRESNPRKRVCKPLLGLNLHRCWGERLVLHQNLTTSQAVALLLSYDHIVWYATSDSNRETSVSKTDGYANSPSSA